MPDMGVNYTRQCAYAIRDNKMPANISKIYKISANYKNIKTVRPAEMRV